MHAGYVFFVQAQTCQDVFHTTKSIVLCEKDSWHENWEPGFKQPLIPLAMHEAAVTLFHCAAM